MKRACVLALLFVACVTPLYANWGGGGAGGSVGSGTFQASGTGQVEMRDEKLSIDLYRDRARVAVDYVLANSGEAVTVKAGFPCLGLASKKKNYLEIEDYHLQVDGAEVPYAVEKGDIDNWKTLFDDDLMRIGQIENAVIENGQPTDNRRLWWLSSSVRFAKGAVRIVRVRYESLYEYSFGGPSQDCYYNNDYFRYLLSTAATWKGPIQNGQVRIRAITVEPGAFTIKPRQRFQATADGYLWRFTNLKPTLADNIEVCLNDKCYTQMNDQNHWYSFEGSKYYFNFQDYVAHASSTSKGYKVDSIRDLKSDTAWVTGRNGGVGESITLTLPKPQQISEIGIVPGYGKSKELYYANNRVREVEVDINGRHVVTAGLLDEYISFDPDSYKGYHLIHLGAGAGLAKTVTLRVKKVYPGTRHNDLCISEVLLRKRLPRKPDIHPAR